MRGSSLSTWRLLLSLPSCRQTKLIRTAALFGRRRPVTPPTGSTVIPAAGPSRTGGCVRLATTPCLPGDPPPPGCATMSRMFSRKGDSARRIPAARLLQAAGSAEKRGGSTRASATEEKNELSEGEHRRRKRKTSVLARNQEKTTAVTCGKGQRSMISQYFMPHKKDYVLPTGTTEDMTCPVCLEIIQPLSEEARCRHVNLCLEREPASVSNSAPPPCPTRPLHCDEDPTTVGKIACDEATGALLGIFPAGCLSEHFETQTILEEADGEDFESHNPLEDASGRIPELRVFASASLGRTSVPPSFEFTSCHQQTLCRAADGADTGLETVVRSTFYACGATEHASVIVPNPETTPTFPQQQEFQHSHQPQKKKSAKKLKSCPSDKRIPGTSIVVDAFAYGSIEPPHESKHPTAYFLSHFHSDHYGGLTSKFTNGTIYCSAVTGELIINCLGVNPDFVQTLPMNKETSVQNVGVTLIEANHCPGAVLFLFRISDPGGTARRVLHTGDFRALPSMTAHPWMEKPIDTLYLDTTYCKPAHSFPSQSQVVCAAAAFCKAVEEGKQVEAKIPGAAERASMALWLGRENEKARHLGRNMFVVGTYRVGKEKVFKAIAQAIGSKVYVSHEKERLLRCYHDAELEELITPNPIEASVHVISLGNINKQHLCEYLSSYKSDFARIYAFRPTGWTYRSESFSPSTGAEILSNPNPPVYTTKNITPCIESDTVNIYPLPYSEHSSFRELARFVMALDVKSIVPTVNTKNVSAMANYFEDWQAERKKHGRVPWCDED